MPKYYETFLCTAVPQSATGTKLRLAVLVSPRLTAEPGPGDDGPVGSGSLGNWPDALNWAAVLPTWTVTITQGGTSVTRPGQEVGGGYDLQTWRAIFPANMPTVPYRPPIDAAAAEDPRLLPGVATFQAGAVRDAVKDLHVEVLSTFRTQFPLLDQLSNLAQFAPIKNALSPGLVQDVLDTQLTGGTVGAALDKVFAQLDLFHGARPGSNLPAPAVTAVSPVSGSPSGGTAVTITGTTFIDKGSLVFFGGRPATNVVVVSPTTITCTTPPGTAGARVDVVVRTPGGASEASPAAKFAYVDRPTVTGLDKHRGPAAGGGTVVVTGTNFVAGNGPDGTSNTTVRFGDVPATDVRVGSDPTSLTCTAPAAGDHLVVDVVVTTAGGSSTTGAASRYTYVAAPVVTAVSPSSGPVAGGQTVAVTGTNLTGATEVRFGAARTTPAAGGTATSLTCTTPAGGAGPVDVSVSTDGGTSAASAGAKYTYLARPTVTRISPTGGPAAGSTPVTVTGTNLGSATSVTFGGVAGTGLTAGTATSMTVTSPAGVAGNAVHVVVHTTLAGASTESSADLFTYGA
jgi:hypothetical protein